MRKSVSFPVIVTTRVAFHEDVERASSEFDEGELLRFFLYRLTVLQAAMHRLERLRCRSVADASQ